MVSFLVLVDGDTCSFRNVFKVLGKGLHLTDDGVGMAAVVASGVVGHPMYVGSKPGKVLFYKQSRLVLVYTAHRALSLM